MKVKFIALIVILMSAVLLTACSESNIPDNTDTVVANTEAPATEAPAAQNGELTDEMIMELEDVYKDGTIVLTPVGEFKLPEECNETIFAEEIPELPEDCWGVAWYTMIDETRVDLFAVYLGMSDIGFYFGDAQDAEGNVLGVYVDVNVVEPEIELTEEQTEELSSLRECVNYIIEQIYALPTFVR